MYSYDLLKMKGVESMELVGGWDGLSNEIRWIYHLDAIDPMECKKWVHQHDLIFMTGSSIEGKTEMLPDIIRTLAECDASGCIVNLGPYIPSISPDVIAAANECRLPLFTIPWDVKLIDISYEVCRQIFHDEQVKDRNFLKKLLLQNISEYEHTQIVLNVDFDFSKPCRVCNLSMIHSDMEGKGGQQENAELKRFITSVVMGLNIDHISTEYTVIDKSVILLVHDNVLHDMISRGVFKEIRKKIVNIKPGMDIYCGIGRAYKRSADFRKSYNESIKAVYTCEMLEDKTSNVRFYDQNDLYGLLSAVSDSEIMKAFCIDKLGGLMEYDKVHNSNLVETLFVFIENDLNYAVTAKKLYLHKNTLRYRITKIETILGMTLKVGNITELMVANYIRSMKINLKNN